MIEVSEFLKNLIEADSRTFRVRILHNESIYEEIRLFKKTVKLPESSMSVGNALCALIECEAEDVPTSIIGAWIKAQITILGCDEWIDLGEFKVERPTVQNGTVVFTAYDAMNIAENKTYVSTLSEGEHTVQEYFDDVCSVVEFGNVKLPSEKGSIAIPEDKISGYSCREALAYLAGFIGFNCIVNRDGLFEMKAFTAVDYSLLNGNRIAEPTLSDADCVIGYISCCVDDETTIQTGTGSKGFEFVSPIITKNQLDSIAAEIMGEFSPVRAYKAGSITQLLGDPRLEICDVVTLNFNNVSYTVPIMSLVFDYDGGLQAEIESFELSEPNSLNLGERLDFAAKQAAKKATKYSEGALKFSTAVGNAMGLYHTSVDVGSGTIVYLHDKPELKDSTYICCRTSEGFAVASSWGGNHENTVWQAGFDREGNAILKMLSVYQVNADHIAAGSITSEKIATKSVTAEKIKVDDISTLNATIANWTIHSNLLYVPSEKKDDGVYNYGVGLSNTTIAFYAGYQSSDDRYNEGSSHPGSPYEGAGAFDSDNVNFYVTRAGKLVAKDAEISGKITSVSTDKKGKVVIDNGGFTCYTTPPEGYILKYGEIKAAIDGNISTTVPAMCIQADPNQAVGLILSASKDSWYVLYREKQTEEYASINDSYIHSFYGNVQFKNSVFVNSSVVSSGYYLFAKTDDNLPLKYSAMRAQSGGDFQIGSNNQTRHTKIYAETYSYIYAMNDFCLASEKGLYVTADSAATRILYYGAINGLTGLHIGATDKKMYLYGGLYRSSGENMMSLSSDGALKIGDSSQPHATYIYGGNSADNSLIRLTAERVYLQANLRIQANKGVYFYVDSAWSQGLFYGSVLNSAGETLSGMHVGIAGKSLYLWGDGINILGRLNITNGIFTNGVRNFGIATNGTLIFGSPSQAGATNIYARSEPDSAGTSYGIGLIANWVNCNANFRLYTDKGIFFPADSGTSDAWQRGLFYGYALGYTGLHIGVQSSNLCFWGTGVFVNGSSAVSSDAKVKSDVKELTEQHEAFFEYLKPKTFKYVDGMSGRTHLGFIAQEVEKAITDAGLTSQDVAAYVSVKTDKEEKLALRYEEFIALNTYMIQKCLSKISSLEKEIKIIKEAINNG